MGRLVPVSICSVHSEWVGQSEILTVPLAASQLVRFGFALSEQTKKAKPNCLRKPELKIRCEEVRQGIYG